MAKGPIISLHMKEKISFVHLTNPGWTAKQVWNRVNELTGGSAPGLSATQKIIQNIKKQRSKSPSKDQPWSLAALNQFPIPADAIPTVLRAWIYALDEMNQLFTTREAIWVSRLYSCIFSLADLTIQAKRYAALEQASEIIFGTFSDSSVFDISLYESLTGNIINPETKAKMVDLKGTVSGHENYIKELVQVILNSQNNEDKII